MGDQIATVESGKPLATVPETMTASDVMRQVHLIQDVMKTAMKDGEHYGKIPGCGDKPALLKAGAEKLAMTFRLAPKFDIVKTQMANGHINIDVTSSLYSIVTGQFLGSGVGSCSTMESKYRFRTGPGDSTGKPVPRDYWDIRKEDPAKALELLGGRGHMAKKDPSGAWMIFRQGEKVEHDNPADFYNTVLKMAKKRAQVDNTLTVLAASDIFAQDIEENPELYGGHPAQQKEEHKEEVAQAEFTATVFTETAAPQSAPMPTEEFTQGSETTEIHPQGGMENTFLDYITAVNTTSGDKAGKPWTKYNVVTANNGTLSTFKKAAADMAIDACQSKTPVRILFSVSGRYKNLETISPADSKLVNTGANDLPF